MDQYKIVISDCHLSAGRIYEGTLNPHEDFHFDDEMIDLFNYFSTGQYGQREEGPVEVELVIAGDYLDFLNVPVQGEFDDCVSEEVALLKLDAILQGHATVMDALRRFASLPGKRITYLIGNHDAELFFEKVREKITRAWDPEGQYPSSKVEVVGDRDRLSYAGGVEIRHGNQFEAGSALQFESPFVTDSWEKPILILPWGSIYVLKVINRLKWERDYVDKVRPVKIFILMGLLVDPWFTLRFCFLSAFYFLATRLEGVLSGRGGWRARLVETLGILRQETKLFMDLEKEGREILDAKPGVKTVIMGHTHRPMNKIYPDGKQYINTGTWTKMINLDWRGIGQPIKRTFAFVHIRNGKAHCELRQWVGEHSPHQLVDG